MVVFTKRNHSSINPGRRAHSCQDSSGTYYRFVIYRTFSSCCTFIWNRHDSRSCIWAKKIKFSGLRKCEKIKCLNYANMDVSELFNIAVVKISEMPRCAMLFRQQDAIKYAMSCAWWWVPVIPASQEAEAGGLNGLNPAWATQWLSETLSQNLKIKAQEETNKAGSEAPCKGPWFDLYSPKEKPTVAWSLLSSCACICTPWEASFRAMQEVCRVPG